MNGKRFSENKARKNGFYLALAVCLVAVGIAAWSTYDAVHSYVEPKDTTPSSSAGKETAGSSLDRQQAWDVRSGQSDTEDREDPEAPRAASPSPAPARQTAGTVTGKTESSRVESSKPETSSEPESTVEEPQIPVNAPLYEISGQMIYPLESQEITKAYSAGSPVYSETMKDWRIHRGTDFQAESGEEVHACANGQVKQAYTDSMLGNVLVIEHGDYEFSYCGVGENFLVKEGDIVTKGQAIGTVTAVPCEAAEKPHLHLEARRDGANLDPRDVIEGK